jgi:hypothetical protein
MARAAQNAANPLNELQSTRAPWGKAATRRSRLRHPPAELGRTARPTASGGIPREFSHWDSRPDLSNEIRERDVDGKPI